MTLPLSVYLFISFRFFLVPWCLIFSSSRGFVAGPGVAAEDAQVGGERTQLVERGAAAGLVRAREKIDVEMIVPRLADHRARLDPAQVDAAAGEDAEALVQDAGQIGGGEDDRGLVG